MTTVYIETNFFNNFAKDKEQEPQKLVKYLNKVTLFNQIVSPAICLMKSLSILEDERNYNTFKLRLAEEISEVKVDINSNYSKQVIKSYLEQLKIQNNTRINDISIRLFEVIKWAAINVELINLKPSILISSVNQEFIPEPTDNLILHCILDHAKTCSDDQKILLTGNYQDFGTKEIRQILGAVGIKKYVSTSKDFFGWLESM